MKTLLKLVITALLAINYFSLSAKTIKVQGVISNDTVWDTDTVKVVGDVRVSTSSCLTIMPGTYIELQGFYEILIDHGIIKANGTINNPITFTVADTTGYYRDEHIGWKGLNLKCYPFYYNCCTSIIKYCNIHYSKDYGLRVSPAKNQEISDCNISHNSGNGIKIYYPGSVVLKNCVIYNNKGYGLYLKGYNKFSSINNTIYNNGGGIYIDADASSSEIDIINNTIYGNRSYMYGGGIFHDHDTKLSVKNTIIWGNSAKLGGNQYFRTHPNNEPEFFHCNIEGGKEYFGFYYDHSKEPYKYKYYDYNNINREPYFISEKDFNFHLADSSSCINTGDPSTDISGFPEDLGGNPRIYDSEVDIIDIGAYEYQGEPVNRSPIIVHSEDQQEFTNNKIHMSVEFFDPDSDDSHNITVTTDNPAISVINLKGDTTGSTYELVSDSNWLGKAQILVNVEDTGGRCDIDTFNYEVSNNFYYIINEDTIWSADTVKINNNIIISSNATLT
ncbi:MAG: right-handed parallel beta-helix repeat-containing protein, partial [Bacteroidales bacterium]